MLEQDGLIQRGWSFIKRIPYNGQCAHSLAILEQDGLIQSGWSFYKEDPLQVVNVHTAWLY